MRKTALICNRWKMDFEDYLQNDIDRNINPPWNYWMFSTSRNLEYVSAGTSAAYELLKDLPQGKKIVEFFGGTGLQSTIIQEILKPNRHIIVEKDSNCIRHLTENFQKKAEIIQADSLGLIGK